MTTNGESTDQAPDSAPTLDALVRRAVLDIASMRGETARGFERLEAKVDAAITDIRRTRAEQIAHGKILAHVFEGVGGIATKQDQQAERILRVEGGLSATAQHTREQWRAIAENRRAQNRTSDRPLKDLEEDTKVRRLPSLSEITTTVEQKIDARELDRFRKRSDRLGAAVISLFIALAAVIAGVLLRR